MKKFIDQQITETLETNYMPYTMSVIVSRAIPEIDGFKPSHRKLLYTMYTMKLLNGARTKSANVVGQTMKLNPHGDQAIYATMVRLTKGHDALALPFVDSKGNFGKVTSRDMKFAAARYTEVKLAQICEEVFKNIDKNAVEFVDNYDGLLKEPTLLPTTFPNILVNPNKGIAVGMASNICSFNLKEMCNYTIEYINNPEADPMDFIMGPDFSTGGRLIYNQEELRKIYDTGVGGVKIRSKYEYIKSENRIEITEIPFTTTIEQIIDKIIDLIKLSKIKEINDLRDETDLKGLKIALDLKRGTDPEKLMAKLFKSTPLEDTFSCNFNVLIGVKPKVLGIKAILHEWIDFRVGCIRNQLNYDIDKIEKKLHLLYGLNKVILDIDKAIRIIRETEKDSLVVPNLMVSFAIDDIQADFVAEIKLRNINKEYILKKTNEISDLEKQLAKLRKIVSSDVKIKKVIVDELTQIIKKYSQERRTEIVKIGDIVPHDEISFIEDYKVKMFVTEHSYIKKVSLVSLRASSIQKLKDDDKIVQEIECNNKSELLFFTDKHNVYKMKAHEISDHKASSLGTYIPNIIELDKEETVIYTVITDDYAGDMLFAFGNGKIAKVPLMSYFTKTNRKKLVKAYSDFSKLVKMVFITEEIDILMNRFNTPDEFRVALINTKFITPKSTKNTKGIQVIRMKKNSQVNEMRLLGETNLKEVERYRVSKIPMSGKEIDLIDRINFMTATGESEEN